MVKSGVCKLGAVSAYFPEITCNVIYFELLPEFHLYKLKTVMPASCSCYEH